jgi:hypothetical protein
MEAALEAQPWYAVRCVFRTRRGQLFGDRVSDGMSAYEERVTLWHCASFDEAISRAELEATEYAATAECDYVGLAQSYHLADTPGEDGAEVFSLIRESRLPPSRYLDRFFDTGREYTRPHTVE